MFTGIVEEIGTIVEITDRYLTIESTIVMEDLDVSESICVNGTCLTVTQTHRKTFTVDTVPETLLRTNLGHLSTGAPVNLERAMKYDGRFGGHIVQGHIDGTGKLESINPDREAITMRFSSAASILRYIVEKGFVAVDGTSLTIVECGDFGFTITVVPYTMEHTVFKTRNVGDYVNIEVDVIAKYVEKLTDGHHIPMGLDGRSTSWKEV